MAFQCAIFQTSAAIEDYFKSVFRGWAHEAKNRGLSSGSLPPRIRASIAGEKLSVHFSAFIIGKDERDFLRRIEGENDLWPFLTGQSEIPPNFDGSAVFSKRKYPAPDNIKVLFSRIGVDNIFDLVSRYTRTNAELRLVGFNSIRTAIAHSEPPDLTYLDVKRNIEGMSSFVGGMDRVIFKTLSAHLGNAVW